MRIFVAENDRFHGRPLHNVLVEKALAMKMAGVTVLPALTGFGHSRTIRTELNVDASPHLPVVVETVDRAENIERFLAAIGGMIDTVSSLWSRFAPYSIDERTRPRQASDRAGLC